MTHSGNANRPINACLEAVPGGHAGACLVGVVGQARHLLHQLPGQSRAGHKKKGRGGGDNKHQRHVQQRRQQAAEAAALAVLRAVQLAAGQQRRAGAASRSASRGKRWHNVMGGSRSELMLQCRFRASHGRRIPYLLCTAVGWAVAAAPPRAERWLLTVATCRCMWTDNLCVPQRSEVVQTETG